MEHNNGGLVQIVFLPNWVIFRFLSPFIFRIDMVDGSEIQITSSDTC